MYFPDLALCEYGFGPTDAKEWQVPLRAVGWLEHPHHYARGTLPSSVRTRLLRLRDQTEDAFWHHGYCGLHDCSLCKAASGRLTPLHLSAINIFVPGNNCVYAAPGAIDHYFEAHTYWPPEEFCDAVLQCPDCRTPEYWEALRRSNGGPVPLTHLVKLEERDEVPDMYLEKYGDRFKVVSDHEF